MSDKPQILGTELIAQSRLFKVEKVHLRFRNDEERYFERLLGNRNAVLVVPVLNNDTLLLVREYAVGIEDYTLAFPKGLIDEGETAEQAANRELQEEVGYAAKAIEHVAELNVNPGYTNQGTEFLIARDLYESRLEGDEPEPIEVVEWPLSDLKGLMQHPQFNEARSIAALMYLQ
jgi:ADP-ribose diphosphatase